jgi:hypothetical protein
VRNNTAVIYGSEDKRRSEETAQETENQQRSKRISNTKQKTYDFLGGEENRGVAGILSNVIDD